MADCRAFGTKLQLTALDDDELKQGLEIADEVRGRSAASFLFARVQSLLVRRDTRIRSGGFSTSARYFNDTELANRIALEGPWLVSPEVTVREIRRDEAGIGIGTQRSKKLEVGYESLSSQLVALRERSLSAEEQVVVQEKIDLYASLAAREWLRKGKLAEARAALAPARVVRPLLRLALMPGLGSLIRPLLR